MKPRRHHIVIPDTQVKPGTWISHLEWIGKYIVNKFRDQDVSIIHLGDHWDMPSLSSYDRGKKAMEGRRFKRDIEAGNRGFQALNEPLERLNRNRRKHGMEEWWPDRHLLLGNHEDRINRAIENEPYLEGAITAELLNTRGWQVHDFLDVVELDGVLYSHYFYNPMTGKPYAGNNLETRLKTIGHSFTMGHQQGLKWGRTDTAKGARIGLVSGSCYLHDEDYLGPQGNDYWRGIIVCHNVHGGDYDPMMVSLEWLCEKYEGMTLGEFMEKHE